MRSHCPICKSTARTDVLELSFIVPDGWTLPAQSTVYECDMCRFTYYDNDATPIDYDIYYREKYGYGLAGADTIERTATVARFISEHYGAHERILDYGAEDPALVNDLNHRGFTAEMYNMNDDFPRGKFDCLIVAHMLEHVYDLPAIMGNITRLLKPYGIVYAEVPNHAEWAGYKSPILGLHQKHINHFRPHNFDALFYNYGMEKVHEDDYWHRRQGTLRRVYQRKESDAYQVADVFMDNMAQRVAKLRAIDYPIIVWGLGDISWYLLDKAPDLQVSYYVDNDPAYRGATIRGVEVRESVTSDEPIAVMAVGQAKALIERIRSECDNEVVVI